jgi:hypothetical protein
MGTEIQAKNSPTPAPAVTPAPANLLQRKCACGGDSGVSGECEDCRKKRFTGVLQTKLAVNQPGDLWELEANRIAESVVSNGAFRIDSLQAIHQHPAVMRQTSHDGAAGIAPASVEKVVRSEGSPLDPTTRGFMESQFGYDFSQVRVHNDAIASKSAKDVNALAYTVGQHIVLKLDQYNPQTIEGRRLLAHELTHVVQQGGEAQLVQRDSSEASPIIEAGDFVGRHLVSLINKDFAYVATSLFINFTMRGFDYHYVNVVFKQIPDDCEDNIAALFTEMLAKKSLLDRCAADPLGRTMLNILYEAMITGKVSDFEREQAQLILGAKLKKLSPEDFIKSTKQDAKGRPTQIFPVRYMRVTPGYDDAPLEAKLISGSKVWVKYPARIKGTAMFAQDFRTLQGDPFGVGEELNANEIVGIRDYETDGKKVRYLPALELIDYSNRVKHSTIGKIVQVSIAAATIGYAGPAAAGAEEAGGTVIAETAATRWAARLALADRVGGYIAVVSFFVQENRDLLIDKLGWAGKLVVKLSDIADSTIAIYGMARFVQGGLKLGLDLRNAAKEARQESEKLALSDAERAAIQKLDADTDALLKEMQEAEAANAKSAAAPAAAGKAEGAGIETSGPAMGARPKDPRVSPSAELNVPGPHPFYKKPAANENRPLLPQSQAAERPLASTGTGDVAPARRIDVQETRGAPGPGQGANRPRMGDKPGDPKQARGSVEPKSSPAPKPAVSPLSMTAPKGKLVTSRAPEVVDQELVSIGPRGARYKPAPAPGVDPYHNYIEARESAVRSAGLGSDRVPHYVESVGPGNAHLVGRMNGSMSPDRTRGWRLDYSPQKGGHINWWRIEGGIQYQGSISIRADEATFYKLLLGHFGMLP